MTVPAYVEFVDFIAAGATPEMIIAFLASEPMKSRVAELIRSEKTAGLSSEETAELNHWLFIEHLMRLTKARARQLLNAASSPLCEQG